MADDSTVGQADIARCILSFPEGPEPTLFVGFHR